MPTTNHAEESRVLAWLAQAEESARTETKSVGPTVSSPMWGGSNWGFADASTPHPADGPTWMNPVVASSLAWLGRAFVQADLEVRTTSGKDKLGDVVSDHPAMLLLDKPNALNTFYSFCQAFLLSDVIDGNSFFIKVRASGNRIHSLWWVPPWDVEIVASETKDADAPIEGYWVAVDGMRKWYEPTEVIHVKDGQDPANALKGLAPLKAGLRSVMTIDRAEMYTQTLMRNCGAIPAMLSPKDEGVEIMPDNVATLRSQFRDNQTGFNNGMPVVAPLGLNVSRLGVTPEEMALDQITVFPLAVVCALTGTPAMVLGYPDPGKTYSNLAQADYSAQVNGVIPRQDRFAEAIDIQCPELISRDRERLVWNRTKVIALHAPVLERLDSLTKAAGGPILTPDEARSFVSLGSLPDRGGETMRGLTAVAQPVSGDGTTPAVAGAVGNIQATALNGAQVTSLVEIANAVATGALPAESARALIGASFPNLTAEQVSAIVGPLIAFEPTTPDPPVIPNRPMLPPPSKSAEREDDRRPFGEPTEAKDDMPPRVGLGDQWPGDDPDDDNTGESDNTWDLPSGEPIRLELIQWFKRQLNEVMGSIPPEMAEIPETFPSLADYNDPMASAMTPILSVYWQESGDRTMGELAAATGLDMAAWEVVNPHTQRKIETAAFAFCESTNKTTSLNLDMALDKLRAELIEGIVEQGDTLVQLRKRVQSVFRDAEDWRAQRIAATEASRAVHAAQEQAAIESEVASGFKWLLSSDACPLCHKVADEVGLVKLGQRFAEIGDNPAYKDIRHPPLHPGCQCTVTYVLLEEYGGPADPAWGETLIQPGSETAKPKRPQKPVEPPASKPPVLSTSYTGKVSEEFKRVTTETVSAIPEHIKEKLFKFGANYSFGETITEILPRLKGERPRGWPDGYTWDHAEALYSPSNKSVVVAEYSRSVTSDKLIKSNRIRGAILHETGHAVDQAYGVLSQSRGFLDAYAADASVLSGSDRGRLGYYLQPGESGPEEAFAELFARSLGGGSGTSILPHFPSAFAWIQARLKQ